MLVLLPVFFAVGAITPCCFLVSGLSASVLDDRNALILAQLETHSPNKERYALIAKVVNVGVALLVYGRDDGVARAVCDVQTQWTGTGPAYMGNKGAVGVRFRVPGPAGGVGETFTCVFILFNFRDGKDELFFRLASFAPILLRTRKTSNEDLPTTNILSKLFFLLLCPKIHGRQARYTPPRIFSFWETSTSAWIYHLRVLSSPSKRHLNLLTSWMTSACERR